MDKLKTLADIDGFVCKLLNANIKLPENVDIKIELSKKEFNNANSPGFKNCYKIVYNTMGIKVFITTKTK